ncbi:25430_t:CDS:2, partial [Racocetra persica]
KVPLEKTVVETDAPYLTPVPQRGNINFPSNIIYTLHKIAKIKKIAYEELAAKTSANACRLFNSGFGVQQTLAYQQFFHASGLTPNEIKFLRDNVNKEEEFIKSFSQATTLRQKQELEAQ